MLLRLTTTSNINLEKRPNSYTENYKEGWYPLHSADLWYTLLAGYINTVFYLLSLISMLVRVWGGNWEAAVLTFRSLQFRCGDKVRTYEKLRNSHYCMNKSSIQTLIQVKSRYVCKSTLTKKEHRYYNFCLSRPEGI